MPQKRILTKRSDKVMFMEIPGDTPKICRMSGFTGLALSKNPTEYSRQYVDEAFKQTDVTGMSPSVEFGFDRYEGDPVHDYMVGLIDNEAIGSEAVVNLYSVDMNAKTENAGKVKYACVKRAFALIPDEEGGETDAYTYSGVFKVKGAREEGFAELSDDRATLTFSA